VLEQLKIKEKYVPDITVFLQCTSPFTLSEDIDGTIHALIDNNADSVFSATEFKHFLWSIGKNGPMVGINHNEKYDRKRRQDLSPQYLETGSVYAFLTSGFLKHKNRFFGIISMYQMPDKRVFEIDTLIELEIANQIEKLMN
jgi:N-acylneuraminate cytidylyltransferase